MSKIIKTIQDQVVSCKKLLRVFQDERQLYNVKKSVGVKEVKTILARKKLIVGAFEAQHAVLKELKAAQSGLTKDEDQAQKETIRELGAILEQLLVIDHENEKLLRRLLSVQPSRATNTRSLSSVSAARPALQRQLPFVPGGATKRVEAARPMVAAPVQRTVNRIKHYAGVVNQSQFESKYA